jgi:manganese/zinc/iron transport system ATP- binding protein
MVKSSQMNSIEVESLYMNYYSSTVLWDVSFQIPKGVLVGVYGPNGAGKSTLLKSMINLITPLSGRVEFFGKKVSYVPQRGSVDWDFPITAFEVVLMGRYGKKIQKSDKDAALRALDSLGMGAFANRQIGELSGGQQQRLFIARSLLQDPDIFLLDEPFTGIDFGTEKVIIDLLKSLARSGKTILVVHHDLSKIKEYFDWLILLNKRLIAHGPVSSVFNTENFQATYGPSAPLFLEALEEASKWPS